MIPTWLAICVINIPCGVAFGLLFLRSSAEIVGNAHAPTFMLFGRGSLPAVVASGFVNAVLGVALFMVPSSFLLWAFDLLPLHGSDEAVWLLSLLSGTGIGKLIRWQRWKKSRDFA